MTKLPSTEQLNKSLSEKILAIFKDSTEDVEVLEKQVRSNLASIHTSEEVGLKQCITEQLEDLQGLQKLVDKLTLYSDHILGKQRQFTQKQQQIILILRKRLE